jgi:hypothetical protein
MSRLAALTRPLTPQRAWLVADRRFGNATSMLTESEFGIDVAKD